MTLIGFLDDRATFVACYADALAFRLLERTSLSLGLEREALSMLKFLAPYEHATKLQRMVLDESASRELSEAFREHTRRPAPLPLRLARARLPSFLGGRPEPQSASQARKAPKEGGEKHAEYAQDGTEGDEEGGDEEQRDKEGEEEGEEDVVEMVQVNGRDGGEPIEMEVLVLTAGAWPNALPYESSTPLPPCVDTLRRQFEAFYMEHHSPRKLAWAHAMSTVDVAARFVQGAPLLRVSTSQLALLLAFRRGPSALSLVRLAKVSRLHAGPFTTALLALLRSGILACDGVASAVGASGEEPSSTLGAKPGRALRQAAPDTLASGQLTSPPSSVGIGSLPDPDAVATAAATALGLPPTPSSAASAGVRLNLAWDPYAFGCVGGPSHDTPTSTSTSSLGASASAFSPQHRHASTPLLPLYKMASGLTHEVGRRADGGSASGERGSTTTSDDLKVLVQAAIVRTLKRAGKAPCTTGSLAPRVLWRRSRPRTVLSERVPVVRACACALPHPHSHCALLSIIPPLLGWVATERMGHADLMKELTKTLAPRMKPEPALVRRCVEYLIDKEYVARHESNRDLYVYVP